MAKRKQIGNADMRGDSGVALIHRVVNQMGYLWNALHLEAGVDGLIEIRDSVTEEVSNCIIQVQSKAGDSYFKAETETSFEFLCKERDLEYWLRGNAPVILVVSRPSSDEAYWISVKDYFKDPKRQKDRKILFDKARDRFDQASRDHLAALALPADSGLYLTSLPESEDLVCNLLPISEFPRRMFRASTTLRFPGQVWEQLKKSRDTARPEWFLHNGFLYSFHDLTFAPWTEVCQPDTTKNLLTSDWAISTDRMRRYVFTRLLRACINELLSRQHIRFDKEKEHQFFRATPDLSERKVGGLSVFKGYESMTVPDRIAYYRHRAAKLQYFLFDDRWYVEITPSYHFTSDGWRISRYFEERLKGIKQIERQNKVHLRQLRLWEEVLTQRHIFSNAQGPRQKSLFGEDADPAAIIEPYEMIRFDPLLCFTVDNAVPEKAWLPAQPDDSDGADSSQLELFD